MRKVILVAAILIFMGACRPVQIDCHVSDVGCSEVSPLWLARIHH